MESVKKWLLVLAALALILFFAHGSLLRAAAGFLVVRDPLEKADAIIVLAGDANGERVTQGVELYRAGWAPKIIMSGGPAAWHLTYAENMKKQARSLGVAEKDIIIQDRSLSTREDVVFSLAVLKKIRAKKVIMVSSPFHMRRMILTAKKKYTREGIKVIACPVEHSKWKPEGWWRRHEDTQPVVYEYMAMVQYLFKGWLI
jgi:uncharacterized SAM-binding protein YcdF (DUF218 family)